AKPSPQDQIIVARRRGAGRFCRRYIPSAIAPSETASAPALSFAQSAAAAKSTTHTVTNARSPGSALVLMFRKRTNVDAAANAIAACGKSLVGLDASLLTAYITSGTISTMLN